MNIELLLLNKKRTDTLNEKTKTRPQETLEFEMNKPLERFSFSPTLNFKEEGKWLLAVISFEANNSAFNITDENNSLSISIPGCWWTPSYLPEGIIDNLKALFHHKEQVILYRLEYMK